MYWHEWSILWVWFTLWRRELILYRDVYIVIHIMVLLVLCNCDCHKSCGTFRPVPQAVSFGKINYWLLICMVQLLKAGASTVLFDPVLQLDTMGIFHNEYPGADSPVTGLVTLLATAKALWSQRKFILNQPNSTDIMFAFFQGVSCELPGNKWYEDQTTSRQLRSQMM